MHCRSTAPWRPETIHGRRLDLDQGASDADHRGAGKEADNASSTHGDDGKRNDPAKMAQKMVREAKKLSAADIANLAAYYQTLK